LAVDGAVLPAGGADTFEQAPVAAVTATRMDSTAPAHRPSDLERCAGAEGVSTRRVMAGTAARRGPQA